MAENELRKHLRSALDAQSVSLNTEELTRFVKHLEKHGVKVGAAPKEKAKAKPRKKAASKKEKAAPKAKAKKPDPKPAPKVDPKPDHKFELGKGEVKSVRSEPSPEPRTFSSSWSQIKPKEEK